MRLPKTALIFSSFLLSFVSCALCSLKFAKISKGNPPSGGVTFLDLLLFRVLAPQVLATSEDLNSNFCVCSPVNICFSCFFTSYLRPSAWTLNLLFCIQESSNVPMRKIAWRLSAYLSEVLLFLTYWSLGFWLPWQHPNVFKWFLKIFCLFFF